MNAKAAPIFNYRKRHRQAILSYDSVKPDHTADNVGEAIKKSDNPPPPPKKDFNRSGLMDLHGNFNRKKYNQTTAKTSTASSTVGRPQVQMGWSNQKNSSSEQNNQNQWNKPSFSGNNYQRAQTSTPGNKISLNRNKQAGNDFDSNYFPEDTRKMWDGKNPQNFRGGKSPQSFNAGQNQQSLRTGQNTPSSFRNYSNTRETLTGNPTNGNSSFNKNMNFARSGITPKPPQRNIIVPKHQPQSNQSFGLSKQNSFNTNSGCQVTRPGGAQSHTLSRPGGAQSRPLPSSSTRPVGAKPHALPPTSIFCDKLQKPQDKKPQMKTKKDTVDRSMRVFTCSINTIQEIAACGSLPCLVIYEIFGLIDSAVMKTRDGLAKEFLLSDENSKLKCIFYEIDRELPKVTRGQVHRVIGRYDSSTQKLKVISVRAAEDEEKQVWHLALKTSKKEIDLLMNEV